MAADGTIVEVFAGRQRTPLSDDVTVHAPFPFVTGRLPWPRIETVALRRLESQFRAVLARADPGTTVAHFWPGTPAHLIVEAHSRGLLTVREMINSALATSGPILDAAYARLGLPPTHTVTSDAIAGESAELELYDYFFASNPEVERSLLALGLSSDQLLSTTFGWSPERFEGAKSTEAAGTFRLIFVGRIGVRKGVPELLEAWRSIDVDGELLLVGTVDEEIRQLVESHTRSGRVRLSGYVNNPAELYARASVFVFPTWEEGGPQVTYEAAAAGLPIITTPMGAARLVEDGRTGIIVDSGSPGQIAAAIRALAADAQTRRAYGAAAQAASREFTYPRVGAQRAALLRRTLRSHRGNSL
ncbi:glycosyltransferase [Cellulomonas sp. McL0617]|uniref:glycosyltransferase n=1 Tax=Cellulomonas sp. McL0617 TaxID=3415675 RepID=UPI003CFA125C